MTFFKDILTAPVFDDETKTQQAYLLHVVLWALIVLPIPFLLYSVFFPSESLLRILIEIGMGTAVNFFLLFLLRRGYVMAASIIQLTNLWFLFTVAAIAGAGIQSIGYTMGYMLVIIIAGILLGGRGAVIATLLTLVSGGLITFFQTRDLLIPKFDNNPLTNFIVSLVLFPVAAAIQYLSTRIMYRALNRARASEEKYRLISQVSTDYTFSTELDLENNMHLSWVAGAFESITGYTFEDYVAAGGWLAHLHPNDIEKDAQAVEKLKSNQPVVHDVRTYTKAKDLKWVRVYGHPVWDRNKNRLVGIFGAVKEITERKQSENELKYERDLLQIFMDNIPDTVYFKDTESRFVRVNQAQARFLNISDPQDAIGKTDLDFQSYNLSNEFIDEEKQIVETGQPVLNRIEFNPTADGKPRWLSATKVAVKDGAGHAIGLIGISRDITEQKKADELEQNRRAMLEKLVKLGQSVTEVSDLRTTIQRIWRGVQHDLGFDRPSIWLYNPERKSMDGTFGTNDQGEMADEWNDWISLEHDSVESKSLLYVLESPGNISLTHNFENDYSQSVDTKMFGVKDHAAIGAWAGEKPVAIITVDNLITSRPITSEQLEALRLFAGYAGLAIENARLNSALAIELFQRKKFIVELESKNAELERFTYTVSHDLKSPLVTIRGFLGYLEQDARESDFEKFRHDKERIETAVEKMQILLKDLLELSRVGRLMGAPVQISFNQLVKEALENVDGQIKDANVLVEYKSNDFMIKCDRVRLVEVLQNLIDNAVKFMGTQPSPRVEIGSFTDDKNKNVFYVKDNGMGIAPEFHEKIFGLFDKLTSQSEGSGVGLALVKRIIEIHGGRIWVESQVGVGTIFYFTV